MNSPKDVVENLDKIQTVVFQDKDFYPECEGFTYFGISPNGSVSFGDLINTPGAYGLPPNRGRPWPGTPQTDFYGFDEQW